MDSRFPGAITLDTLPELFAHHAARFGGWSMKDDDDDDDDLDDDTIVDPGDNDDADDDDDDDDDKDAYVPPTKEEWEKTQAALKKANDEAKRRRLALKEAQAAGGKDDDADDKVEKKVAEVEAKWKPRVINSAASAALLEAGAEKPERLLKLIDHDDLDVADDGSVDGLDDEVDRLKEEYPELFKRTRSGGKVETGGRGGGKPKPKSATERQAAAILRS